MRRTLALLALLAALPCAGTAAAQAADSAFLRPGDAIRLAVWRQPDFSGDFRVSPEGTIEHPLLSDVSVVGVSRSVIRDRLRAALSRYEREPGFVFDYLYRVAVGGEVRLPNLYTLSPETTLGEAIAAAGGVNEFGRLDRVHLLRDGHDQMLDLTDPAGAGIRIHSGDQLRVTRRTNLLRDVIGPTAAVLSVIGTVITIARR